MQKLSREQAETILRLVNQRIMDTYGHGPDLTGECLEEVLFELTAGLGDTVQAEVAEQLSGETVECEMAMLAWQRRER